MCKGDEESIDRSREEVRKVAYDILLVISSSLGNSVLKHLIRTTFVGYIVGYLSGSSPHIKSGAVSMLSVLVCEDANNCISVTDLSVLGLMKVVVSWLQAEDSQSFLTDVLNGVLPWSSVSRSHFRSKLDEFQYKCRLAAMVLIEWRYDNVEGNNICLMCTREKNVEFALKWLCLWNNVFLINILSLYAIFGL
ncbi:hypothetical protein PVL29_011028 [Vitis rotundifolia]|uniref:Uncharacterized protein n=1 Tax=Vitis rotundifolia TaxID=103349 RepID=A0AA39DTS6_VITRO|nr:hypothetical protein PVL29_011028 [Vitis rotundifolia]